MAGRSLAKLVGVGLGALLLVACGVNPTPQGERLTEAEIEAGLAEMLAAIRAQATADAPTPAPTVTPTPLSTPTAAPRRFVRRVVRRSVLSPTPTPSPTRASFLDALATLEAFPTLAPIATLAPLELPTFESMFWQEYDSVYLRQPNDEARYDYRRNHPFFDSQGVTEGLWPTTVATQDRREIGEVFACLAGARPGCELPTPDFSGLEPTR